MTALRRAGIVKRTALGDCRLPPKKPVRSGDVHPVFTTVGTADRAASRWRLAARRHHIPASSVYGLTTPQQVEPPEAAEVQATVPAPPRAVAGPPAPVPAPPRPVPAPPAPAPARADWIGAKSGV